MYVCVHYVCFVSVNFKAIGVALLAMLVMAVMAVIAVIWMKLKRKYCKWSAQFHHMLYHMIESYDVRKELPEVSTYMCVYCGVLA